MDSNYIGCAYLLFGSLIVRHNNDEIYLEFIIVMTEGLLCTSVSGKKIQVQPKFDLTICS